MPNVSTFGALIQACTKEGAPQDGGTSKDCTKEAENPFLSSPDDENTKATSRKKSGCDKALEMFRACNNSGQTLDEITYKNLIQACCARATTALTAPRLQQQASATVDPAQSPSAASPSVSGIDQAMEVFDHMTVGKHRPDLNTCRVLVGACARTGRVDEALRVWRWVEADSPKAEGGAGASPSRIELEDLGGAGLEGTGGSMHRLLVLCCAASGKAEEAASVLRKMEGSGSTTGSLHQQAQHVRSLREVVAVAPVGGTGAPSSSEEMLLRQRSAQDLLDAELEKMSTREAGGTPAGVLGNMAVAKNPGGPPSCSAAAAIARLSSGGAGPPHDGEESSHQSSSGGGSSARGQQGVAAKPPPGVLVDLSSDEPDVAGE